MDFDTPIRGRVRSVRDAIAEAERSAGRPAGSVRLLAVSKTQPAAAVRAARSCGVRDFGENYLQEALPKIDALAGLDIDWHFVGAVQSNKARDIARRFAWVHAIDRAKVAARIDAAAARPVNVCLQVNIDAEPRKAGVAPDALPELARQVAALPNLRLRGLMAIPQPGATQCSFRRLRGLFDALAATAGAHWDTLSMGMSGDFAAAIAEGATIVRIGTALFGARSA